jgi:hypothetical protein
MQEPHLGKVIKCNCLIGPGPCVVGNRGLDWESDTAQVLGEQLTVLISFLTSDFAGAEEASWNRKYHQSQGMSS